MRPHKEVNSTVPQNVGGPVAAWTEDGGKRKGRKMKRKPREVVKPRVTVGQAKAALAIDPNAVWDQEKKMLVYFRKVGE
jgi:hypothetical protein